MHAILLPLGIVTAAAGFIAIGFGIPVTSFSFGNTLIIAGTICVVGGFILIALASAIRQLHRIAESGGMHALAAPHPAHADEPYQLQQPMAAHAGPGMGSSMRPEPSVRPPAPAEPKLTVSPAADAEQLAWLRPKSATPTFGEQALIAEMEASLSPTVLPPGPGPSPRLVQPATAPGATPQPKPSQAQPSERVAGANMPPAAALPGTTGLFDTVWPEARPVRDPETIARARRPDETAPPRDEVKQAKVAPSEPQMPATPPEGPRPAAILKSGVIDGMSYTLYVDGSIEAVLESGPIKFASIDALRDHLEKNG